MNKDITDMWLTLLNKDNKSVFQVKVSKHLDLTEVEKIKVTTLNEDLEVVAFCIPAEAIK